MSDKFRTRPFGPARHVSLTSDVESLTFDGRKLVVRIALELVDSTIYGIDITTDEVSAFRLLDEADLAEYWTSSEFHRGYPVLEVISGGWSTEEESRRGIELKRREWLVVSGNRSVSLLSQLEPQVCDANWPHWNSPER
jgi:hypothetical protein